MPRFARLARPAPSGRHGGGGAYGDVGSYAGGVRREVRPQVLLRLRRVVLAVACASIAGCASTPEAGVPPPHAAAAVGVMDLLARPAERALLDGMRAYEDGQYAQAEALLRRALASGLASGRDRANAHKLLAFITCTSERPVDCAAEFSAARKADPAFQLSRSEAGHPLWGPVFRRLSTEAR